MRAVLQRVARASVRVAEQEVASIGSGLLVLLGVRRGDSEADLRYLAEKISKLRLFESRSKASRAMDRSVLEEGKPILVVSQFTLYGDTTKGRRPSFEKAESPERAKELIDTFVQYTRELGVRVLEGRFGAHMQVELVNDGPVTLLVDSSREF